MNRFNLKWTISWALALAGILTPAGCADFLAKAADTANPSLGRVVISFGGGARNLYPAVSGFTKYEVSFTGPDGKSKPAESFTGGTQTIELEPGDWTLTVTAYSGAESTPPLPMAA